MKAADGPALLRQFTSNFRAVRWAPDPADLHGVFFGEYPWAPAYRYQATPYYLQDGWSRGDNDKLVRPVLSATVGYLREASGYDCSLDRNAGD